MKKSVRDRIADSVTPDERGCLNWNRSTNRPNGYGQIYVSGRLHTVTRVVWEMDNGPIPDGMYVDHLCHNRKCCNVDHLRLATPGQNEQNRRGAQRNSRSGVRGVQFLNGKYVVRVMHLGKTHQGGRYATLEEADAAAKALRADLFGPDPRIA